MRAAVVSVWTVIVTIAFVQTANGLQTSLLGVRAGIELFPAWTFGLIMASYYVGYTAAIGVLDPIVNPALGPDVKARQREA